MTRYAALLLLVWTQAQTLPLHGQSLAELARQEKSRRQEIGKVSRSIEMLGPTPEPPAVSQSSSSGPPQGSTLKTHTKRAVPLRSSLDDPDKRYFYLLRRGPAVWRQLRRSRAELREVEKELAELGHRSTPIWRRGRVLENPELIKKRRDTQRLRAQVQALEQEWRHLQTAARRAGLPPGLLRGDQVARE